jgi:hypothetical protein
MNQNKKLWFFAEGYSEENFPLLLIRRYFPSVKICKSPSEFLKGHDSHVCYIHNSKGEGRIPFDITSNMHFIDRAKTEKAIVICDLETSGNCPIEKKEEVISRAQNDARQRGQTLNLENFSFVISTPTIESIYCSEKKIVGDILKGDYEKNNSSLPLEGFKLDILDDASHNSQTRIKMLFQNHGLYYDKRRFSERFFGRLDYPDSANQVVQRLYKLIQGIW